MEVILQGLTATMENINQKLDRLSVGTLSPDSGRKPTPQDFDDNPDPIPTGGHPWYGVARGVVPGVYPDWASAGPNVLGFSGAVHKKFPTHREAVDFVQRYRETQDAVDKALREREVHEAQASARRVQTASLPATRAQDTSSVFREAELDDDDGKGGPAPTIKYFGVDPSGGKDRELFGLPVGSELMMTKELSPDGLMARDQKELAASLLDATSLPGRYSQSVGSEATTLVEDLTAAVQELGSVSDRKGSEVRHDPQWRSPSKVSIKDVKTEDDLVEILDGIRGVKDEVLTNVGLAQATVFGNYHWDGATQSALLHSNLFARIGRDTLENYIGLIEHVLKISRDQGWQYASVSLAYHAKKLVTVRVSALNRLHAMAATYIYLRDSQRLGFVSPKLQEKRNHDLQERLGSLSLAIGVNSGPKCGKCGGSSLVHPVGRGNCIFKATTDKQARKKASQIEAAYHEVLGRAAPGGED